MYNLKKTDHLIIRTEFLFNLSTIIKELLFKDFEIALFRLLV